MPTVPTADTTDIMQAALDEAGFNADGEIETADPDPDPEIVADPDPEVVADPVADPDPDADPDPNAEVIDPDAVAKAAAKVTNQDEFDALCDELGFRAPKAGQRENKIPQSRVRARVKTALKKYSEKFGTERTDLTGKLSAADTELQTFRRVDQAIAAGATDPAAARRYIEMLAAVHPAYKAFLGDGSTAAPASTVPQSIKDLGPKPGPDLKYDDGTTGFSQEQLDKRDEWLAASAEIRGYERSKKEFETRFGPMETAHKTALERAAEQPRIEARVAAVREQWGELFLAQERTELAKKGSSEIAKYQAAHPGVPFEQVVAAVLLPKLQTDRTKMRTEILAELKRKPVASTAPIAAVKPGATEEPTGPRSTQDVIREALREAGHQV